MKNLQYYNKKFKKSLTAPELSKLIKSKRRQTTGKLFEFWIEN